MPVKHDTANRSFGPLYLTNFFGVLNDNFLKTLASFSVIAWIDDAAVQSTLISATAAALVVPFVLLSPLADRLTAVFPKCRVVRLAKIAEIPIVLLGILGFAIRSVPLVIASVCLMGAQSALYSPAKYALVRDIGGPGRISTGTGGMEGVAFLAMLVGTIAAAWAFDATPRAVQWAALVAFAGLGCLFAGILRAREEPNHTLHAISPVRYFRRARRMARRQAGLQAVIVTLSVFWWAAATMQMGLLVYGRQVLGLDAAHTGGLLALAAVGIVAGQVVAGFADRRKPLLPLCLPTGLAAAALLLVLYLVPMAPTVFAILLGLLAFDLGFFKLPLDADIQKKAKGPRLNTMLAYFNQVSFLFMMGASVTYMAVSRAFGPRAFLPVLAAVLAATAVGFARSRGRARHISETAIVEPGARKRSSSDRSGGAKRMPSA